MTTQPGELLPDCPFHAKGCEACIETEARYQDRMIFRRVVWDCGACGPFDEDRAKAIALAAVAVAESNDDTNLRDHTEGAQAIAAWNARALPEQAELVAFADNLEKRWQTLYDWVANWKKVRKNVSENVAWEAVRDKMKILEKGE